MPLYGYFGAANYLPSEPIAIAEIADHCDFGFLGTWACTSENLAQWHIKVMQAGAAAGIHAYVLGIDVLVYTIQPLWRRRMDAEVNVRAYLTSLRDANLLRFVHALYPIDEPNGTVSEDDVFQVNAVIRKVLMEFDSRYIKIAVCYGGLERPQWWQRFLTEWLGISNWVDKAMPLVGLTDYDIVGANAYELGADILKQFDRLLPRLRPSQQVMLFPGGASPWRQDPAPFMAWAKAHSERVFAVVPFLWFDRDHGGDGYQTPGTGIRTNGMASTYRAAGKNLRDE